MCADFYLSPGDTVDRSPSPAEEALENIGMAAKHNEFVCSADEEGTTNSFSSTDGRSAANLPQTSTPMQEKSSNRVDNDLSSIQVDLRSSSVTVTYSSQGDSHISSAEGGRDEFKEERSAGRSDAECVNILHRAGSEHSFHSVTIESDNGMNGDNHQENISIPILGYEVQEQKSKFTVFKLQVKRDDDIWCIFRRYTDFTRLNDKLATLFPHFRLSLPPKRWFKDNFDREFLEDRLLGLQAFVNNIIGHRDLRHSQPVRRFFCLDNPPSPYDTLEGSKAICESLEERCYELQRENEEKDHTINLLQQELNLCKTEIANLKKTVRSEGISLSRRGSQPVSFSTFSTPPSASFTNDSIETSPAKK